MKMRRHYLALRGLYASAREREPVEVTTQELAAALDCTHRNMVLLLQRMQREGWLGWEPKRGRGNRSSLQFLADRESMLIAEAQELADKHDLQQAISYLREHDDGTGTLQDRFRAWLSGRFGFHTEVRGQRRLDVLRFPLQQRIYSLDPVGIHYAGESHLVHQLFDGLVRMSQGAETVLPHIAHAWETDAQRLTWTFHLRKGVLFHNGRELFAEDVKFSFERLRSAAPKGLFNWVYGEIAVIETPNERTVSFRLHAPNELFLSFLTTNRASIVPRMSEADDKRFGQHPIGTGPFRLSGNEHGVWVLEAFPAYFQGRGFLDIVEVWTEPGGNAFGGSSEPPEFQVMHNVRLTGPASEKLQQIRHSGMTCKFMTVNELRDGPLRNPALRHALHLALDRAALIERLSGDVIEAADSFWMEELRRSTGAKTTDETKTAYGIITDAKQTSSTIPSVSNESEQTGELEALAAAGYAGETIVLATIPQYRTDAELVRDELARSGIRLELQLITAELFQGEARLAADLLLFAVMLDEHRELRLVELFKSMLHHLQPEARHEIERCIDEVLALQNRDERKQALLGIEAMLASDCLLLFLYRKRLKTAFHPSVRGISLESLSWVRFKDLWFKPEDSEA